MSDSQSKKTPFWKLSSKTQQRVISVATIVLDIAKESTDVFPPLKSCLAGIDAFRKHYGECKDVEERVKDLIPWLENLENIVVTASPDVNPEETERREQFNQSLDGILKRAGEIKGKNLFARFVDKAHDSDTMTRLAEELRQAILIYQLSQQKYIETQVSQLAISFNAFLKLDKRTPGVKEKIESALSRLDRLKVEGGAEGDGEEPKHRVILFETLEGMENRLRSLSDCSQENHKDMQAICGLAEDVRDAVIEYQVHQQNALYDQNRKLIGQTEWLLLNACRRAHGAGYQHGNRSGCLKGTRESVLSKAEKWAENSEASIFWLHGLAGTGKTTIAQTVAEILFADGRLGASFFCSRNSEDRSDLQLVFPTLAFQLAQQCPKFRSSLIHLLQSNPDITYQSLQDQVEKFLIEPFRSANISTVIVIDALDECRDEDLGPDVLSALGKLVLDIPRVKLFITSRPETHIVTGFDGPLRHLTGVFILHQVKPDIVNQDICHFFEHELSKLAQRHGGKEGWPTVEQLNWLSQRTAGFFVHAVATVNVLDHHLETPWAQLDTIMEFSESTAYEGEAKLKGRSSLDTLYVSILQKSFHDNKAKDDIIVRSVLSCVALATDPLSPPSIATLMGLNDHNVRRILELTRSLLVLPSNPKEPVRPFHKSFPDFITDRNRCADPRFYISPDYHIEIFMCCLKIIGKPLKNMPPLPDPSLVYGVTQLPRIEPGRICGALRYACGSWHRHLVVTEDPTQEVLLTLLDLLEKNFIFWLTVLEALDDLPRGRRVMGATAQWLKEVKPSTHVNALLDVVVRRRDLIGRLAATRNLYAVSGLF